MTDTPLAFHPLADIFPTNTQHAAAVRALAYSEAIADMLPSHVLRPLARDDAATLLNHLIADDAPIPASTW
jgi:hypothetical protein